MAPLAVLEDSCQTEQAIVRAEGEFLFDAGIISNPDDPMLFHVEELRLDDFELDAAPIELHELLLRKDLEPRFITSPQFFRAERVYFLCFEKRIVYVGLSMIHPALRSIDHTLSRKSFDSMYCIMVSGFKKTPGQIEQAFISKFRPYYNRNGKYKAEWLQKWPSLVNEIEKATEKNLRIARSVKRKKNRKVKERHEDRKEQSIQGSDKCGSYAAHRRSELG